MTLEEFLHRLDTAQSRLVYDRPGDVIFNDYWRGYNDAMEDFRAILEDTLPILRIPLERRPLHHPIEYREPHND